MRKLFASFLMLSILASCNNSSSNSSTTTAQKPEDPNAAKGAEVIANNDCLGCHSVSTKIKGPSYEDVAKKYADAPPSIVDTLAEHIIYGSGGHWGDSSKMTPHPNLSLDDAKVAVKYILSLKNSE